MLPIQFIWQNPKYRMIGNFLPKLRRCQTLVLKRGFTECISSDISFSKDILKRKCFISSVCSQFSTGSLLSYNEDEDLDIKDFRTSPGDEVPNHHQSSVSRKTGLLQTAFASMSSADQINTLDDIILKNIRKASSVHELLEILDDYFLSLKNFKEFIFRLIKFDAVNLTELQSKKMDMLLEKLYTNQVDVPILLAILKVTIKIGSFEKHYKMLLTLLNAQSFDMTLPQMSRLTSLVGKYRHQLPQMDNFLLGPSLALKSMISREYINSLSTQDLIMFFNCCVVCNTPGLKLVLNEILSREISKPDQVYAIFVPLLSMCNKEYYNFFISKESKHIICKITHHCVDVIASNVGVYSSFEFGKILRMAAKCTEPSVKQVFKHPKFLDAICSVCLSGLEFQNYSHILDLIIYSEDYLNVDILKKSLDYLSNDHLRNITANKLLPLFNTLQSLDHLTRNRILSHLEDYSLRALDFADIKWDLRIIEFLTLDYIPNRLLTKFYHPEYINKFLDSVNDKPYQKYSVWKNLLFIDHHLSELNPNNPYLLPKDLLGEFLTSMQNLDMTIFSPFCKPLEGLIDENCFRPCVPVRDRLFVDLLVVTDKRGMPLPLFDNWSDATSFDLVFTTDNIRKIALLKFPKYKGMGQLYGSFCRTILEANGYEVLLYAHSGEVKKLLEDTRIVCK